MGYSKKKIEEMDAELRELARTNYDRFCEIVGIEWEVAYMRLDKSKGMSYGQIAQQTGHGRATIAARCKRVCQK
jgi:transposase